MLVVRHAPRRRSWAELMWERPVERDLSSASRRVVIVLEVDMIGGIEMMYKGVFVGRSYTEIVGWSELRGLGRYL
jgi:hypothetical protein